MGECEEQGQSIHGKGRGFIRTDARGKFRAERCRHDRILLRASLVRDHGIANAEDVVTDIEIHHG